MRVAWIESVSACPAGFGIVGMPDPGIARAGRAAGRAGVTGGVIGGCGSPLVFSARTSSVQVGHRSSGFLESPRPMTARSASGSALRSGVPLMCCINNCRVFAPLNGRCPVSNS